MERPERYCTSALTMVPKGEKSSVSFSSLVSHVMLPTYTVRSSPPS